MKKTILTILIITITNLGYTQISDESTIQENICLGHSISFYSKILDENRTINVYLPASYFDDSNLTYPVIYLLDGSLDEEFIPTTGLVELLSSYKIKKIPESIVVGIESENRTSDFTSPTQDEKELRGFPPSGNSKKFIDFISDELLVLIKNKYNVSNEKTIVGNSFGGLLVSEILLTKSNLFNNYILISPSFSWNNNNILKLQIDKIVSGRKVYIAALDRDLENKKLYEKFIRKLKKQIKKAPDKHLQCFYQIFTESDHGNINHLAIYNGLKTLNQ